MNIEEIEVEVEDPTVPIDGEISSEDEFGKDDPVAETMGDLWESLDLLEKVKEIFDDLTDDDPSIDMPLELNLKIYKLKSKIENFLEEWDTNNQIDESEDKI